MAGLTLSQVAKRVGHAKRSLEYWILAGEFPAHDYRAGAKGWRFWYSETIDKHQKPKNTMQDDVKQCNLDDKTPVLI